MKNEELRGTLAEFIVARALNIENLNGVEWDLYNIIYRERKIAVKSAEASDPVFDIRTSERLGKRASDLYVFAMYIGEAAGEPQDVSLWCFWVLSTPNIDRTFEGQETVSVDMIRTIAIKTDYAGLKSAVDMAVSV